MSPTMVATAVVFALNHPLLTLAWGIAWLG